MGGIKIFVSSRIDVDSYCPDNSIFIPVRCGAVYDKEQKDSAGDDTGDNISERRMSFNELTVQYWAWKNEDADYFGLCHYKRFLNFTDTEYPENYHDQVEVPSLNEITAKKYGLTDSENIEKLVRKYDVLVVKDCPVKQIPSPMGYPDTVFDLWEKHSKFLLLPDAVSIMMESIEKAAPEMKEYAEEYLESKTFRGLNCFVMRKDLFDKMCEFEFSVLFEVEKHLDTSHKTFTTQRTCGYLSEILFSIFIYYLQKQKKTKIKELQILVFDKTEKALPYTADQEKKHIVSVVEQYNYTSAVVQLKSIVKYGGDGPFHVTYLEHDLRPEMKEQIKRACKGASNVTVSFYNPTAIVSSFSERFGNTPPNFWQFLLPWFFDGAGKVLFLNINSIIQDNITPIFECDIQDKLVAAVKSTIVLKELNNPLCGTAERLERLHLDDNYSYFDSGVLLINLEEFRKSTDLKRIENVLFGPRFTINDIDLWNLFARNENVRILDYKWNIHATWPDALDDINDLTPLNERSLWRDEAKNPMIVTSDIWRNPDSPFANRFWSIARETELYERFLCEMFDSRAYLPQTDTRSSIRKLVDKLLPRGTRRREFVKKLVPKGLRQKI